MIANADTPDRLTNHPLLEGFDLPRTGIPTRAGIILTKNLLFVAEGTGAAGASPIFRAVDKQTGDILAEIDLPANQTGLRAPRLSNRRPLKQSLSAIYKKPDSKSAFLYMAKRDCLRNLRFDKRVARRTAKGRPDGV